jgi:hypothetical protein
MGTALLSSLLALACLRGARGNGESGLRFKLYWAGMCFLVIAFGAAYMKLLEWRSPDEVSQFLPPYPRSTVRSRPPLAIDGTRAWIFETSDAPKAVGEFYAAIARSNGWPVKREFAPRIEVLVMRQPATITTILAAPEHDKTEITFMVRAVSGAD